MATGRVVISSSSLGVGGKQIEGRAGVAQRDQGVDRLEPRVGVAAQRHDDASRGDGARAPKAARKSAVAQRRLGLDQQPLGLVDAEEQARRDAAPRTSARAWRAAAALSSASRSGATAASGIARRVAWRAIPWRGRRLAPAPARARRRRAGFRRAKRTDRRRGSSSRGAKGRFRERRRAGRGAARARRAAATTCPIRWRR